MPELPKVDLESKDLVAERIEQMKALFPEIATEGDGTIDFEKLRLILGDEVDEGDERFTFTWPGKLDAIRQAQTTSHATLRPSLEDSLGWDETQNVYIEGDNLEVLKLMQRAYHGKIKMIYIDPPYNTGHDFVYKDRFSSTIENYREQTGLLGQSNADTSGSYHANWCSMMYPRLKLARELLSEDGILFVSIDENEFANLKKMLDEIFGESNAIPTFNRVTKKSSNNGDNFSPCMDYVLGYAKDIAQLPEFSVPLPDDIKARYRFEDEYVNERGKYQEVGLFQAALKHGGSTYPIECPDGERVIPPNGQPWRWNQETYTNGLNEGRIVFKRSERTGLLDADTGMRAHWNVYTKVYLKEREGKGVHPKNFSDEMQNTTASTELKKMGIPFDFAKPVSLIKFLAGLVTEDSDIILDFFSGSATTAQSIMELNSEDGGNRRFILVQLPELIDSKTPAGKQGYMNICQIGEERIRRAGKAIREHAVGANSQLKLGQMDTSLPDTGFRVLKLDDSGIQKPEEGQLLIDRVKPGRTDLDIIFEMMLKWGLELTYPVEQDEINGYPVYSIAYDELICCMQPGLTVDTLEAIAARQPRRVFLMDSAIDDTIKLNALQIFKRVEERTQQKIDLRTV